MHRAVSSFPHPSLCSYDGVTVKTWAGASQWRAIQSDWQRFRSNEYTAWGSEGFWALAIHRLYKELQERRPPALWRPLLLGLRVMRKVFVMVTFIDIHPDAEIGPGLFIPHGGPIRVHGRTKIGADCALHHGCTIGEGPTPGGASIGDHVFLGCHSAIIGQVTIGDGAMIAANSLVIGDVPAGCTAIGVPAKILPQTQR
jgi:serine O-acetyltransferase